jgi:hypothetical protein
MEDSPEKSILRKKLYEDNYKLYVKRISEFKLKGDSKTVNFCKKYGNFKGLYGSYARFFDNAILYNEYTHDTFFPFLKEFKNTESVNELIEWGIPEKNALIIISESIEDLNNSSIFCNKLKIDENIEEFKVTSAGGGDKVVINYKTEKVYLTIFHLEKLLNLYNTYNKENIIFQKFMFAKKSKKTIACIRRIFCMIHRYEIYFKNSVGLQGSVTKNALSTLRDMYNINTECFASPLNCYLDNYYSAFYDTDKFFGSKGNFFESFFPKKGQFELNPPFILELMDRMTLRLVELLENGNELIFFVIVPHWSDAFFCEYMKKNKFTLMYDILKKKEHNYIDGMQHIEKKEWSAKVDSIWFLMTNIKNLPKYKDDINNSFGV